MIITKNYRDILEKLKHSNSSATVRFECLSKTDASASLFVERVDEAGDSGKTLIMTFGQNSATGQSMSDMRERVRVYEGAIEYGEMLKARLEAEGFIFVCDEEQ